MKYLPHISWIDYLKMYPSDASDIIAFGLEEYEEEKKKEESTSGKIKIE